jgi:hypothetical protein
VAAVAAVSLFAVMLRAQDPTTGEPAGKTRIGTYDSRVVALVWSRSDCPSAKAWSEHRDKLIREAREAQAAGREEEFERMERELIHIQYFQHAIVFSTAPPESALAELAPRLPAIAREAGVVLIVPRTDWQDPSVEAVDVTDRLVAEFKPTAQAKKMLGGFKGQRPITLEEVTRMRD